MASSPPAAIRSPAKRLAEIMAVLQGLTHKTATDSVYEEIIAKAIMIPPLERPAVLFTSIAQAFSKPIHDVYRALRKVVTAQEDFDHLVPPCGWIHDYIEWTRQTEPPTVFHYFVAATAFGSSLGRRVAYDKGAYKVFPSLRVMLLAPSGRCRKTSAANLGTSIYYKGGGHLVADKVTPEALIDSLAESTSVLLYAPELAAFLGKQKYQEGMVPLLTAMFDDPEEYVAKTISRGSTVLKGVNISALFCSTVEWLKTSVPEDVFGGGFMSRLIFVVQESTPRCFPTPPPLDAEVKATLVKRLRDMRHVKGTVVLSPAADAWHDNWYRTRRGVHASDKQFSGYFERKPDHLVRLAMINTLSQPHLDPFRIEIPQVHDLAHLRDRAPGGRRHDRTEVARRLAIDEVAPAIAAQRLDQREVGADRMLEHVVPAVDHARLLAFGEQRAEARG